MKSPKMLTKIKYIILQLINILIDGLKEDYINHQIH